MTFILVTLCLIVLVISPAVPIQHPFPAPPPTPPPPFPPNGDVRDTDATASGHGRRGWNQRRHHRGPKKSRNDFLLAPSHRRLQRVPSAMINHRLSLDGSYLRLRTRSEETRGERKRRFSFERSSKLSPFLLVFLLQPSVNYLIVPFADNFCLLSRV